MGEHDNPELIWLRKLAELAREFSSSAEDSGVLLQLIARRVAELFGGLCAIRLLSDDGLFLEAAAAIHHPGPELSEIAQAAKQMGRQRLGEGIAGKVANTGVPVLVPVVDVAALLANLDPARRAAVAMQNVTSLIVAPLQARGRIIGVITLTRSDSARPLTEPDLHVVQDIASHASLAIANATAYAAVLESERALRESNEAHRLLFGASPLPLFVFDVETLLPVEINEEALRLYGYSREEMMQLPVTQLAVSGQATARQRLEAWGDGFASGTTRYRRKDGSEFDAEYTTRGLTFAGRRSRMSVIKDITDRQRADQTLALLASIVDTANDAIISKDLDGTITSWNAAAERLYGHSAEEAVGQSITLIVPADRRFEEQALLNRVSKGERVDGFETVRSRKDGTTVTVSISIAPVRDASGRVIGASKTARDLTERRRANEQLRRTEDQLRQAQKMEAVGRLAGGVAHDFNNILSVILSYSIMLLQAAKPDDPARGDLEEIQKASLRAADLTRQLLTFSRQKVVEPKVLSLNDVLAGMEKMLHRLVGEDVAVAFKLGSGLDRVRVDAGGVEQAVMNLIVNARDAMPLGGKLTLETADVELDAAYASRHFGVTPGPHVMLAITDSGVGMDAVTQSRAFEPFFTTKAPGKGTGLGLATVFGFMQQFGGSVWVYSELGKGTTFKLYFPAITSAADVVADAVPAEPLRGTETVLLVEDQESVRTVAQAILRRAGYQLLVAQSGAEALLLAEAHLGRIDLLVTDVVMPQMSGAELAKRLARTRSELKVLCMSGYTDDSVVRHGVLESGLAFLQKPFTPDSLTKKVRDVLSSPRGAWLDTH